MADHFIPAPGAVLRFAMLSTHYRKSLDFTASALAPAEKSLRRLMFAATPTRDGPPVELIECLGDALNTPGAIALMHRYRKAGEGEKLFASLRFLGFFEGHHCFPDEWKTLSAEEWAACGLESNQYA